MKTLSESPGQLVLERKPVLLAGGMIVFTLIFVGVGLATLAEGEIYGGLMFTVLGGGMGVVGLWAFVRRTMVIFNRGLGSVTIRRKWMTGYSEEVFAIADIAGADLQISRGDNSTTSRPVLQMRDGTEVPLVQVYVSGGGARRTADGINRWLAGDDPRAS